MKSKGLNNRHYNVLFHVHTVTGITLSAALFVIFYAGAFALFRHELFRWEDLDARHIAAESADLDRTLAAITDFEPAFDAGEQFTVRYPTELNPYVQFFGARLEHPDDDHTHRFSAYLDPSNDYAVTSADRPKTTVGETLYRLHYFEQIPYGIHISGLVALFFLLAIVTGVLIHWRNIITKFYAFTTRGKWKQIWTNAHTVLGVIGLPFQVVFAVTGAFFGLLTLLLIPSALVLFGGDTSGVVAAVSPDRATPVSPESARVTPATLNAAVAARAVGNVSYVSFANYGHEDATATVYYDDERTLAGIGYTVFRLQSGEVVTSLVPGEGGYTGQALNVMLKLHFGDFGGYLLRVIYFLLAMLTCGMLLSGILLWRTARNNKQYSAEQKRFHHRVTKLNLAVCLSLFPATALLFVADKLVPFGYDERAFYINTIFFLGWLLLTLIGLRWDDFGRMNVRYLLVGGLLSLGIPVANGVVTGDWVWSALAGGQYYVASVDVFWLFTGVAGLMMAFILSPGPFAKESNP